MAKAVRRILLATMGLEVGGAETHVVELALELRRRGYHVAVASNGGVYESEITAAGIEHYSVPMNTRKPRAMLRSLFLLRDIIEKEQPDVVHAHARIPAFLCGLLCSKQRFAFVTTAHGVYDTSGGLSLITNWGRKTLAVSDDIKQYLIDNYKLKDRDITVTVNGTNTVKFAPPEQKPYLKSTYIDIAGILEKSKMEITADELGIKLEKTVICHVSRLDEGAAITAGQLIEIAPELYGAVPDIQILIVGDGSCYEELKAAADAANLTTGKNTVIMAGARTDVNVLLTLADLFVGVSRSALESLATGVPTILAGWEWFLGLFTKEKRDAAAATNFTCRGLDKSTSGKLRSEILRTLDNYSENDLEKIGAYGRELVEKEYSVSRMANDALKAYDAASHPPRRVLLSGYYGFGNAGDDAILQSILRDIEDTERDVSPVILSADPKITAAKYGCKAINRFNIFRLIAELIRCDVLLSGGGSLLQDKTSTRSLLYYLMIIRTAELFGKKVYVYANGIGPVSHNKNRRRVAGAVSRADAVTVRDLDSKDELFSMGVTREDITVTSDPVFTMRGVPLEAARELLHSAGVDTNAPFIAVSVRKLPDTPETGEFFAAFARLLDNIHNQNHCGIVFIVMQPGVDTEAALETSKLMKTPSKILENRQTAEQLIGIIGAAQLMIAMRLHALIFAARAGVGLTGVEYDPKVESFLKTVEMPSLGAVDNFDEKSALSIVSELLEHRAENAHAIAKKANELEALSKINTQVLVELLD